MAGWNSVALISLVFICTSTLFLFYQESHHFDISRLTDGFHTYAAQDWHDDAASHSKDEDFGLSHNDSQGLEASLAKPHVDLVVASTTTDNTTWVSDRLRNWRAMIYNTDDPDAPLTVPLNKGKETMVYLTYIIDNYHSLPDYAIFTHANRFQWHNDDPDYDGLAVLRRLQLPHIHSQGYVNLRCVWVLGCPVEIRPFDDEGDTDPYKKTASVYKRAFQELMPGMEVPPQVGQSCCAQFAATRETILSRERSEYEGMREWIMATDLDDATSGRVFEYMWHIIFGKEAVHCPDANACYCKLFGLCDLQCEQGQCENRYTLPPSVVLPDGWPLVDWDGSSRRFLGTGL